MSIKINNDTANGSATIQANNTATGDVVATLPPFSTELAPRMQLMTAKTASGTSVDFTGIPSWAKKITVMLNGVSTSGTSILQIQLGILGGTTTTGYSVVGVGCGGGAAAATYSTGFGMGEASTSSHALSGSIILSLLGSNIWVGFGAAYRGSASASMAMTNGSITLGGVLTNIRLTTINGTDTFDAGTINILVEG